MAFEPGSFVVCVDDDFDGYDGLIRKGTVYRVRRMRLDIPARGLRYGGALGVVWLEEHPNPLATIHADTRWGYAAARFRPLKDSSLSIFREALEPAPRETETA